jgi:GNAT superfamily N-acetyltransferase
MQRLRGRCHLSLSRASYAICWLPEQRDVVMNSVTARRLSASHEADRASWAAVRELCCRTGENGAPIAQERWELFSRIWIEPYEKIVPQWTYVAESGDLAVGYLTGCPNSRKFYRMKLWRATLPLLMAIAGGQYRRTPGAREVVMQALGLRRSLERRFTPALRRTIARAYPAHLHINVAAGYRRRGIGRRLIESYFADLRRHNVSGVHLFCGPDPVEFYRLLGFQPLENIELGGVSTFALGAQL